MSKVDIEDIKKLRDRTGLGMMDCKKALDESKGDHELALDILKKKGEKVSLARSDKDANQGKVFACIADRGEDGVLLLLACETDFVAMTTDFKELGEDISAISYYGKAKNIEQVLVLTSKRGITVKDMLADLSARVGEKIIIKSYSYLKGDPVFSYVHNGGKIGSLLSINKEDELYIREEIGMDIAMHIVAMNPIAVNFDMVSKNILENELSLAKEKSSKIGKNPEMIEKIAKGMVEKSINQQVLEDQPFVKNTSITVKDHLNYSHPSAKLITFVRFSVG